MVTHHGIWGSSPLLLKSLADGRCVLVVPPVRLSNVGSRAFLVTAAQIWNSLQEHIVSAPTLQFFRRHLKMCLLPIALLVDLVVALVTFATLKKIGDWLTD